MRSSSASALAIVFDRLRTLYDALVRVRMPRIFGVVLRNPRDSMFAVALMLAVTAIVVNGLFLQPGQHPAPIFAVRPPPPKSGHTTAIAAERKGRPEAEPSRAEAAARADAAKSDPAPRNDPVPLPRPRQNVPQPPRLDAAAVEGSNPPWQVSAVQRTLNQAGYGPIRVNGILDDSTREGIARFERDHNLPVTGQNTARVRHALGAVTGRMLD
ncbi:MAG: peptidoglycan-binding protein [Bradyrhizobiaceae bacterium]|nr:peptidoglycan-binding protein [Bradyrhizobiaceae bacterium]